MLCSSTVAVFALHNQGSPLTILLSFSFGFLQTCRSVQLVTLFILFKVPAASLTIRVTLPVQYLPSIYIQPVYERSGFEQDGVQFKQLIEKVRDLSDFSTRMRADRFQMEKAMRDVLDLDPSGRFILKTAVRGG